VFRLTVRAVAGLGAILAAIVLVVCLRTDPPLMVQILTCGLVVLAMMRPADALAAVAALVPIAGIASGWRQMALPWTQPLVIAALTGWLARAAIGKADVAPARPFRAPWLVFMVVIAASVAVELSVIQLFFPDLAIHLWHFATEDMVFNPAAMPGLWAGTLLVEGLLLFSAVTIAGRNEDDWRTLSRMLVAGGCGMAVVNVYRLFEVSFRMGGSWQTLVHAATTVRMHAGYSDVNAAGSFFVLIAFTACGVVWQYARRPLLWMPAILAAFAAVWLTASRAAVGSTVLLIVGTALWWICSPRAPGVRRAAGALTLTLVVLLVVGLSLRAPDRMGGHGASESLRIRRLMTETAGRMIRSRPVFGIGIGQFYGRSAAFMSAEMAREYPRENAHDNYLQVGAELGLVGLVAFVWLLATALASPGSRPRAPASVGLLIGMIGFLLTCLTGHPLLVDNVAYPFWIALGLLAVARSDNNAERTFAPAARAWGVMGRRVLAVAMIAIVLSVAPRAARARDEADLEHVGFGVGPWYRTPAGELVREGGTHVTIFLPAQSGLTRLPLRLRDADHGPVTLHVLVAARPANELILADTAWHVLEIRARSIKGPRFYRVDLVLDGEGAQSGIEIQRPILSND
jgi:O-antigen ligase